MRHTKWFSKCYRSSYDKLRKQLFTSSLIAGNSLLHELVDDCLQEAYLLLWKKRESLLTHPNIDGWVFVTATNLLNDKLRAALNHQEKGLSPFPENMADVLFSPPILQKLQNDQITLERLAEMQEVIGEKKFRLIFDYYCTEKTHDQLAAEMGISPSALRSRIKRITAFLREYFSHHSTYSPIILFFLFLS